MQLCVAILAVFAYRECVPAAEENNGQWAEPIMDACIEEPELSIKKAVSTVYINNVI